MKSIIEELTEHMDFATEFERKLIASTAKIVIANKYQVTKFQELKLRALHRRIIARVKIHMNSKRRDIH
jgi:hypothetical protein